MSYSLYFNLITCKCLIISRISIVLLFVLIAIVFRESSNVPNSFFFFSLSLFDYLFYKYNNCYNNKEGGK